MKELGSAMLISLSPSIVSQNHSKRSMKCSVRLVFKSLTRSLTSKKPHSRTSKVVSFSASSSILSECRPTNGILTLFKLGTRFRVSCSTRLIARKFALRSTKSRNRCSGLTFQECRHRLMRLCKPSEKTISKTLVKSRSDSDISLTRMSRNWSCSFLPQSTISCPLSLSRKKTVSCHLRKRSKCPSRKAHLVTNLPSRRRLSTYRQQILRSDQPRMITLTNKRPAGFRALRQPKKIISPTMKISTSFTRARSMIKALLV